MSAVKASRALSAVIVGVSFLVFLLTVFALDSVSARNSQSGASENYVLIVVLWCVSIFLTPLISPLPGGKSYSDAVLGLGMAGVAHPLFLTTRLHWIGYSLYALVFCLIGTLTLMRLRGYSIGLLVV